MTGVLAWLQRANGVLAVAGVGFFVLSFFALAVLPNQTLQATHRRHQAVDGHGPVGERTARPGGLHPRGVRLLPLATDPLDGGRRAPVRRAPARRGSRPATGRTSGARGASGRTCRGSAASARATGTSPISTTRATSSPTRTCRPIRTCSPARCKTPTREALDLIAYLETLGRDARLAGPDGPVGPAEHGPRGGEATAACSATAASRAGRGRRCCSAPASSRASGSGSSAWARRCSSATARAATARTAGATGPARRRCCRRVRDLASGAVLRPRPEPDPVVRRARLVDAGLARAAERAAARPGGLRAEPRRAGEARRWRTSCRPRRPSRRGSCSRPTARTATARRASRARWPERRPPADELPRGPADCEAYAEQVLAEGIIGTSMASFRAKLSEPERRLLARFVRTLYVATAPTRSDGHAHQPDRRGGDAARRARSSWPGAPRRGFARPWSSRSMTWPGASATSRGRSGRRLRQAATDPLPFAPWKSRAH